MAKPKQKKSTASFLKRLDATFKTIESNTFRVGFSEVDLWVDMGNLVLNRIMSGRFDRGLLFGRNYVLFGESGSGKSLIAAIIAANAQREHGAGVIWLDVEHATDDEAGKQWLKNAGLDLENLEYLSLGTLQDIKMVISTAVDEYRLAIKKGEDSQPLVIVVDSWAAALTEGQLKHANEGKIVGDMGQKAKQTGDVILATTHLTNGLPIMVIGIQHIMDNQDGYGRKHKTTGGNKQIYMASGCLLMTKKELKEEDTNDRTVVEHYKMLNEKMTAELKKKIGKDGRTVGITCVVENLKSRVSKPFEKIEMQIPYLTGLDRYSGLFDLCMLEGVVRVSSQGWYEYTKQDGEIKKFQKNSFRDHADDILKVMQPDISDFDATQEAVVQTETVVEETENEST